MNQVQANAEITLPEANGYLTQLLAYLEQEKLKKISHADGVNALDKPSALLITFVPNNEKNSLKLNHNMDPFAADAIAKIATASQFVSPTVAPDTRTLQTGMHLPSL